MFSDPPTPLFKGGNEIASSERKSGTGIREVGLRGKIKINLDEILTLFNLNF